MRPWVILVIDDSEFVCRNVECWLEDSDIEVITHSSFFGATRACAAHLPDLVLLDIHMGAFNGADLVESIRSASPKSKIVLHSDVENARVLAEASGADGVMPKQPDASSFLLAVDLFLCPKDS